MKKYLFELITSIYVLFQGKIYKKFFKSTEIQVIDGLESTSDDKDLIIKWLRIGRTNFYPYS